MQCVCARVCVCACVHVCVRPLCAGHPHKGLLVSLKHAIGERGNEAWQLAHMQPLPWKPNCQQAHTHTPLSSSPSFSSSSSFLSPHLLIPFSLLPIQRRSKCGWKPPSLQTFLQCGYMRLKTGIDGVHEVRHNRFQSVNFDASDGEAFLMVKLHEGEAFRCAHRLSEEGARAEHHAPGVAESRVEVATLLLEVLRRRLQFLKVVALCHCQDTEYLLVRLEPLPAAPVPRPTRKLVEEADEDEGVARAARVDGGEVAKRRHYRPEERSGRRTQRDNVDEKVCMVPRVLAEVVERHGNVLGSRELAGAAPSSGKAATPGVLPLWLAIRTDRVPPRDEHFLMTSRRDGFFSSRDPHRLINWNKQFFSLFTQMHCIYTNFRTVRSIGRAIADRAGAPDPAITSRHLFGRLAIALWRGNASLWLHRHPTLSLDGVV